MSRWWSATAAVGICCLCVVWLAVGPTAVAAQGPAPVTVTEFNGSGTAADPYVVTNVSELQAIDQSLGANYTLGGDIDGSGTVGWFGGEGFSPVGNSTHSFTGSLDGSEYRILNVTINRSAAGPGANGDDAALFGYADGATISNLTVVDASILAGVGGDGSDGTGQDGGFGGNASGLIAVSNAITVSGVSVVDSNITAGTGGAGGDYSAGGGDGGDGGDAGGLIAVSTDGSVTDSLVSNTTVAAGDGGVGGGGGGFMGGSGGNGGSAGGIAGQLSGTIVEETAVVGIDGTGGARGEGGLGDPSGLAGTHGSTGGAIGSHAGGTLRDFYAQGTVDGPTRGIAKVGGLVGTLSSPGSVRNSSANVSTNGSAVGGLVGGGTTGTVLHSFATGTVTGTNALGGLIGSTSSDLYFDDSYWDTERTGQTNASDSETNGNLVGLSTSHMTGNAAESNMGQLDFTSRWLTTDSYPRHRWAVENVTLTLGDSTITDAGSTSAAVSLSLVGGSTTNATTTATLTSTNNEVLTVSGSTITAADTGTAQISTTVAGITDSVTVTVEASEEEADSNDGNSGGGGSSSTGDDDDDSGTTTVTAVDTTDKETTDTDENGDETTTDDGTDGDERTADGEPDTTVRVSSASASVRGGSTLEITLPPTPDDEDTADGDESVDEGEEPVGEPVDDEAEQQTDDDTTDSGDTDGEAGDSNEADANPNRPPPPPVSQAEIERVEIDVSEDVDAEVEIRQSRSPPSDDASEFQRDDGTQAAGYIQVTDNLDDNQVTEGRLTFRVSKADLETDAADPENVALYHYIPETDEWEELDTEILGETDGYVRFRGTTPGFSQFAAGIKRAQFEISDAIVDVQQISLGDSIQVEAIVTNTGGADGTFTTQLLVDSEVVAEDVLTIASGGQRATIFDYEFDQADTYQVRVNDVITGEIQVTDPDVVAESTNDSLPGFGAGVAVVSLFVTILLFGRRSEV